MSGICLLIDPVPVHCFSITFYQHQPIKILKPLLLPADKGSLSCTLIVQNLISDRFRVCFKFTILSFAFCHYVTSFHLGKQCNVRKYRLSLIPFEAELGCI